ncbi:MAG: tyrosine-type recombinase/integrase [Armatimonadetes bacterium]|nr:tyrosine-type recombinase/integrase [Armatimonadota bacterium]
MPPERASRNHLPEVLTENEARTLVAQTNPRSITGLRNRVALVLMLRAGLRVSEVCHLAPKDVDLDDCALHIWRGKGAKDRVVYLDPEACALLQLWWERRPKGSHYLLPVVQTGRRGPGTAKAGTAMSPRYLQALVTRLAKRAGIEKRVHPHTLRHTYATEEVKAGTPLHQVQKDLGHAHLATTAVYLHVFDKERQERARNRRPMGLLNGLGRAAGKTEPEGQEAGREG